MQLSYPEPECVLQACESTPENGMGKGCKSLAICTLSLSAEREGFEPPEPLSSTVFKTAAIDHSAISPWSISPHLKPIRKGG